MGLFQKLKHVWSVLKMIPSLKDETELCHREVAKLQEQLKSLQAIDYGWLERGKVIVLAHVGDRDYIEVVDLPRKLTITEYKDLIESVKHKYGAHVRFVDGPWSGLGPLEDI